jgi:hypothetical protein
MLVPILLFNWIFVRSLPPAFHMKVFWNRIPWTIAVPENVFRTAVMILPLLMRFRISEPGQKVGFALYLVGLLVYFASWAALMIFPRSPWSSTALGFLAPAYTPILWLGGISMVGDQLQFPKISLHPVVFGSLSLCFLLFHNLHAHLVYSRDHVRPTIPQVRQRDRGLELLVTDCRLERTRMSLKTLLWILLAATALGAVLQFNYWASFQLFSTLAYAGIVAAVFGLANLAVPFRFLGICKRVVGALTLAGGVVLTLAALFWPTPMIRAAQHKSILDDIMPEYQFSEKHWVRIHTQPGQAMKAVRESTWGDLKALVTLLKIRGAVLRTPYQETGAFATDKRIFDVSAASGPVLGGSDHEIAMAWGADVQAKRPLPVRTLQEFADYRQPGAIKICMDFNVEDASGGWSTVTGETRVLALNESPRGLAIYWRLMVPGSGLLRRQWLESIKRRAETEP